MSHKTLYIVRHAKSDWDSDVATDHERPLNKRGLHDAPIMGRRLASRDIRPELIISSSATRAWSTAQLIAAEIGYNKNDIKIASEIYGAGFRGLEKIVHELDSSLHQVMLVGHNPDITEFVNQFSDASIINIPTCGIATLQMRSGAWEDFALAAELIEYDYPKKT